MPDVTHRPGCPATGGYGHGVEPCICGGDTTPVPKVKYTECGQCGMVVHPAEYHPYAACLMFQSCKDGEVVRANLDAVRRAQPAPAASPAPVVAREPVAWASGDWLRAITETELALIPNTGHDKGRRDRCRAMYRIPLYAEHGIKEQ